LEIHAALHRRVDRTAAPHCRLRVVVCRRRTAALVIGGCGHRCVAPAGDGRRALQNCIRYSGPVRHGSAEPIRASCQRGRVAPCNDLAASEFASTTVEGNSLNIHVGLTPIISLLAGILILVVPRLLNFIVAVYLIVIGLIGLLGAGAMRLS